MATRRSDPPGTGRSSFRSGSKDGKSSVNQPGSVGVRRPTSTSQARGYDADSSEEEEATEMDMGTGTSLTDAQPEGVITEFKRSLNVPIKTDMLYRRVVATAQEAWEFQQRFEEERVRGDESTYEVAYGHLRVVATVRALRKMRQWVQERSVNHTLEVQGRFLARRRPDHIFVDDFLPLPSFCQSLAYEADNPAERKKMFGAARMRTISPDDWKPHETRVYEELGIFSAKRKIEFDPLKVQIPFHSHHTKSVYQDGPSPGDYDHLHHLKWLYAPVSGKNILYSGVALFHIDLPYVFPQERVDTSDDPGAWNPADVRVIAVSEGKKYEVGIPVNVEGLTIGRDLDAGLPIIDGSLSRRHVRVYFDDDGLLMLEDLASKNGVHYEGRRITKPTAIRRPGKFRAGDVDFEVRF